MNKLIEEYKNFYQSAKNRKDAEMYLSKADSIYDELCSIIENSENFGPSKQKYRISVDITYENFHEAETILERILDGETFKQAISLSQSDILDFICDNRNDLKLKKYDIKRCMVSCISWIL